MQDFILIIGFLGLLAVPVLAIIWLVRLICKKKAKYYFFSSIIVLVASFVLLIAGASISCSHEWTPATCMAPQTCSLCQETSGVPLSHSVSSWETVREASCASTGLRRGVCQLCSTIMTEQLAQLEHQPGEWQVVSAATPQAQGQRAQMCTECGTQLKTENYEMTDTEYVDYLINNAATYSYSEIARYPDDYKGAIVNFIGKVMQVTENGDDYILRVAVTNGTYGWDDYLWVEYTKRLPGEARILEGDIISLYGIFKGTVTYESVLGSSITIPAVSAKYFVLL